jgi:dienelactone hydrolase
MQRIALTLLAALLVHAAGAQELLSLETRKDWNNDAVRLTYALWPAAGPTKALVVAIPGGNSDARLATNAGAVTHNQGRNPLMIGQQELGARGIALALVGLPSDRPGGADMKFRSDPAHAQDIAAVGTDAAKRTGAPKVIVAGAGSGAISAFFAAREVGERIGGVVALGVSTGMMRSFDFSRMKTPTLMVFGAEGRCDTIPLGDAQEISRANGFAFLPVRGPLEALGTDPCALGSAAFFAGREKQVVAALADWIEGKPLPDLMEGRALTPLLNERVVFIPQRKVAGSPKLETTLYRPDGDGRFALVVMSHGIPGDKVAMRQEQRRFRWVRQAEEFVKRGFVVAIPMRRGYGRSEGVENPARAAYAAGSGLEDALDIEAVVEALSSEPYVDATRVIALGQSGGGLASLALATKDPPWLKAVLNFAGGLKGGDAHRGEDWEGPLVREFAKLGATNVPSVWIYTENDSYFGPALVKDLYAAYTKNGAKVVLHQLGPFGRDGHGFWGAAQTIPKWWPLAETFLREQGLLK